MKLVPMLILDGHKAQFIVQAQEYVFTGGIRNFLIRGKLFFSSFFLFEVAHLQPLSKKAKMAHDLGPNMAYAYYYAVIQFNKQ